MTSKKIKKLFCIVTGAELKRGSNGNGLSKEKRKQAVLIDALCGVYCTIMNLESSEVDEEVKKKIREIVKDARATVKQIDQESNDLNTCSFHHPAKKAVCRMNDLLLPMKKEKHVALENYNVTPAENMMLGLALPMYAEINARFILNGGENLSRAELVDIVMDSLKALKKIPEKDLRRKLMRGLSDPSERMRNMLTARGVKVPQRGQY